MPRRQDFPGHFDRDAIRRELIGAASSAILENQHLRCEVASVPLFRDSGNGELEQAIRISVENQSQDQHITLSVDIDRSEVDHLEATAPHGNSFHHLFVPEVTSPVSAQIQLSGHEVDSSSAEITIAPQRKWTVSLIHHSHFDYGYTDPQPVVMDNQLQYLDSVLDLIDATDDWPDDAKFRWNVEVTYPLMQWLRNRPRPDREALLQRVREGRIEINGLPFSMHTEAYSIDELAWGFRYMDALRNDDGLEIVSAIQSDVPGATVGLLNLMTAADLKYFAVAHNYAGRSVPHLLDGQDLTRPFWWQAENGKRILVWYTDTPHGVAYMEGTLLGLHESAGNAQQLLPSYLSVLATQPYPYGEAAFGWHGIPDDVEVTKKPYPFDMVHFRIQNTFADNSAANLDIAQTVRDWNERWAFPRLRMDTNANFFSQIESRYGDRFATYSGDWTDWWVDGIGSGARSLGMNRRAQHAVRAGRTLHTLGNHLAGESDRAAEDEVDGIYERLALFDEHTWGAANPWHDKLDKMESGALQWERKSAFAYEADARSSQLVDSGIRKLAQFIAPSADADASLLVFNPSGRQRTDLVQVFLPDAQIPIGAEVKVIAAESGAETPHTIDQQSHTPYRAKGQWLNFLAEDVPSAGYARYDLYLTGNRLSHTLEEASGNPYVLENEHFTVEIDPRGGFIASIIDKTNGNDLVNDEAPFGFNEYIYERYATAPEFNHLSGRIADYDLELFGSRSTSENAVIISRVSNAIEERITLRMTAEGADWLETTIALPTRSKQITVTNRLAKQATLVKESGFFAFPFSVKDANPEYGITGGVSSPESPHVPGSARHMFAIRNWVAASDTAGTIAWATAEAPLVELGELALPYNPFPPTVKNEHPDLLTIYSWVHNNIWDTNFPQSQGGEMLFRYAIRSGGEPERTLGMETAASISQPLIGMCISNRGSADSHSLPSSGSFIELSDNQVELISIAPGHDDKTFIALLHSNAESSLDVNVSSPLLPVQTAAVGNFLERNTQPLTMDGSEITMSIAAGELLALILSIRS